MNIVNMWITFKISIQLTDYQLLKNYNSGKIIHKNDFTLINNNSQNLFFRSNLK